MQCLYGTAYDALLVPHEASCSNFFFAANPFLCQARHNMPLIIPWILEG